jgi:hypothetical protein
MFFLISYALLCWLPIAVLGFPMFLVGDVSRCAKQLIVGETMMGQEVVLSDAARVELWRGEQQLNSGDTYVFGETLEVKLSPSTIRTYLLEVSTYDSSVSFSEASGCDGKRITNGKVAQLKMRAAPFSSDSSDNSVSVSAVWAKGYGKVLLSTPFILRTPSFSGNEVATANDALIGSDNQDWEL